MIPSRTIGWIMAFLVRPCEAYLVGPVCSLAESKPWNSLSTVLLLSSRPSTNSDLFSLTTRKPCSCRSSNTQASSPQVVFFRGGKNLSYYSITEEILWNQVHQVTLSTTCSLCRSTFKRSSPRFRSCPSGSRSVAGAGCRAATLRTRGQL